MKKTVLRSYAKLIARAGVNIEKGQKVVIAAELDQPEFVRILVEECYRAGAGEVTVDWTYQPLAKLHVRHQSVKTLSTVEKWEEAKEATKNTIGNDFLKREISDVERKYLIKTPFVTLIPIPVFVIAGWLIFKKKEFK